ncbi:hypothetical protein PIROE2DRAFT_15609 [Piromyces sp. E2]|nr:hypothetical protein PIROE2DRAFT_15609 [Piromyces sp. E2]|eukprot:OUM58994.1 hypothetical protein PIROE2DRAFT_15609 [Piromyces sp. E2]
MNYLKLLITIILLIWNGITVDVYIPNDYELSDIEKISMQYVNNNDIKIYINEEYYVFDVIGGLKIKMPYNGNLSVIGNPSNKTLIDFTNKKKYNTVVDFSTYTGQTLTFENIIFYNFIDPAVSEASHLFYSNVKNLNFNIVFKNCVFDTGNMIILKLDSYRELITSELNHQILFESCKFNEVKYNQLFIFNNSGFNRVNRIGMKIINSEFTNCNDIIKMEFGITEFDNCKFSNLSTSQNQAIFGEIKYYSILNIKNTIFFDINETKSVVPFITINNNFLSFYNVTMENVHNKLGYLIRNTYKIKNKEYINIESSTFDSQNSKINITNSVFKNLINPNTFSNVVDIKNGEVYMNNCEINNIR